jgi:transcriptional regulator with XRE-family HTH domain
MRQMNEQKFKSAKVLCMKKNRFAIPDLQLKPIGLAIQTRRLEQGLSQEALAEKINLCRTYISLIETKSCNFTMKIFMELAYALELNPSELLKLASSLSISKRKKD